MLSSSEVFVSRPALQFGFSTDTDVAYLAIGWQLPVVGAELSVMQGSMPNIVALPYGQCPPLHFQAPNWRHLLMLMARLPGTRIEPTIDAMAQNKFDMRLRTVIQFIRVSLHLLCCDFDSRLTYINISRTTTQTTGEP